MRVEAVRKALFDSASDSGDPEKCERLGRGELKVTTALEQQPAAAGLEQEEPDAASFALLRTLTGLGIDAAADARQRMLELEALQLSQSAAMEALLPDPDSLPESAAQRQRIAEALATHPNASQTLREALKDHVAREPRPVAPKLVTSNLIQKLHLEKATAPKPPKPIYRRLRVYAYDPSLSTKLETLGINEAILNVQWEDNLQPGPVGEYLEVVDVDPASQCAYAPVDLNDPHLLVQDGIPPSEANPRFHQQMVYAVAMKTIEYFERALGRRALWSPRRLTDAQGNIEDRFVQRLRIYPHGTRAANAYYSPDRKALLFGYFAASESANGEVLPGGLVFSALSHDIIAHETTHALLDGLHRRFREPTNRDVFAFHEAFADIVALFQHFTIPEALRQQIARTRGDLQRENLLAQLAVEFGQATRGHGALRDAIGRFENGKWEPNPPLSRAKFNELNEPHDRGAVLVAAVFDAFLRIYRGHVTELIRLATGGTGVLPEGDIPAALVDQLARKAAAVASQVLTICIRALDYAPPTDITFGDYLRALITADRDLVPDDKRTYRVAFISAFRDRGIFPAEVKSLSVGSLAWEPPPIPLRNIRTVLEKMSLSWDLNTDRRRAYDVSLGNARKMHAWLMNPEQVSDAEVAALGLFRGIDTKEIGTMTAKLSGIEVHSVRPARRVAPDGRARADLVIEITQRFQLKPPYSGRFRGGCTLLVDLEENEVRYFVRKRVDSGARVEAQLSFQQSLRDELRDTYFAGSLQEAEPFAMLHRRH